MMDEIILTRDPGWVNVLLVRTASNSSVTLLSDDDHQTTVPMTALLAASPLIRAMLVDTGLHPSLIGHIVLSLPGTDSTALSYVGDILNKGGANMKDISRDIIDEVKKVFQMLGVAATLSLSGIIVVGNGNITSFDEVNDVIKEEDEILNDNEETLPSSDRSLGHDPSSSPPLSSLTYPSHDDEVNVKIDIKFEIDEAEVKKVVKEPVVHQVKRLVRKKVDLTGVQGVQDHVEDIDPEEARTKKVKQKASKNVKDDADSTKLYSDNMVDSCKTVCKVCQQVIRLSEIRRHSKTHGMSIQQYKEKYDAFRHHILQPVYHHKCGLCGEDLLLDWDTIHNHCRTRKHGIKWKEYSSRFLVTRESRFMVTRDYYRDESFDIDDDGKGKVVKAGSSGEKNVAGRSLANINVVGNTLPSKKKRKKSNEIDATPDQARRQRRRSDHEEESVSMSTPPDSLENESFISSSPSLGAATPKPKMNNLEGDDDAEVNSSQEYYENERAYVGRVYGDAKKSLKGGTVM